MRVCEARRKLGKGKSSRLTGRELALEKLPKIDLRVLHRAPAGSDTTSSVALAVPQR